MSHLNATKIEGRIMVMEKQVFAYKNEAIEFINKTTNSIEYFEVIVYQDAQQYKIRRLQEIESTNRHCESLEKQIEEYQKEINRIQQAKREAKKEAEYKMSTIENIKEMECCKNGSF